MYSLYRIALGPARNPYSFKNKVVIENAVARVQATLGGSLNRCSHRTMYQAGSSIFLVEVIRYCEDIATNIRPSGLGVKEEKTFYARDGKGED